MLGGGASLILIRSGEEKGGRWEEGWWGSGVVVVFRLLLWVVERIGNMGNGEGRKRWNRGDPFHD